VNPLLGFSPDLDPAAPGVVTDCVQMVPTSRGMRSAPAAVSISGLGALPAQCRGAAVLQKTAGTRRTFAGTQTRLYELASGTWSGVSATYGGSSENRWSFAAFGDVALATNDNDQLQYSTAGTFAAVAGAPKARILVSVPNFVVALNTQDATASATYGDSPDRWWCSAFQDAQDWTPSTATQCTTGRLIGGGGEITAGAQLGSGLVVYKAREMFLGQYAGPPTVFDFQRVPGDQGCVGPEAVTDIGGAHIFVGEDNIWLYDGSRPIPISENVVRQWFYDDLSAQYKYRTIVTYDRNNGRVWIYYPSTLSSGNPDSALVYHLASKRWGRANRTIEAAMNYVTGGLTWDTLSTLSATWDGLPDVPWDSQSWQVSGRAVAVFDTDHNLKTLTGSGEPSSLTTGDIGDDSTASFVSRVRLRFYTEPTTGTVTGSVKTGLGLTGSVTAAGTMSGSKFDTRQAGKWHRFAFQFTGNVEVGGVKADIKPAGAR
jgi:hypothetical protein